MSTFEVNIVSVRAIEPIANADTIELAVIGDYRSVVRKGDVKVGALVAYIPEASIVPNWLLERMNLVGKLSGPNKDRVKAVTFRGCLSQGLIYTLTSPKADHYFIQYYNATGQRIDSVRVWEGDDVASLLGVVKYEPVIPTHMSGEIYNAGTHLTVNFDIENIKKFPDVIQDGDDVVMTEKIHGTFCGVGILPERDWDEKHFMKKFVVFSKGQGAEGLCFRDTPRNRENAYLRALLENGVFDKLQQAVDWYENEQKQVFTEPLFLLGEVYGSVIQDLAYGVKGLKYRAFEAVQGYRGSQRYYDYGPFVALCEMIGVDTAPRLYRGPFSKAVLAEHTSGKETVSGTEANMREGVVVKPVYEKRDSTIGRVILKSVSEQYITRKNGTEYT